MKAVCCDRCGKFEKAANFKPENSENKGWLELCFIPQIPEILLCPECAQYFRNFMGGLCVPSIGGL